MAPSTAARSRRHIQLTIQVARLAVGGSQRARATAIAPTGFGCQWRRPPLVRAAAAQLPRRPSPGQPAEGPPPALRLPSTRLARLEEANCTVPRV